MFIGDALANWSLTGHDPQRTGNDHPTMAPHGTYPCLADEWGDRWIAIACQSDDEWRVLAGLIGRPAWSEPASPYASAAGRLADREPLDAAIAQWTRPQGHIDLMHSLQAAGVTAGAVMNGPDLLDDPHLAARGSLIAQDRPGLGVKHYPAQPYRFANAAPPQQRAPLLGEHTNEVLTELLGLGGDELDALERDDVTGTVPLAARAPEEPA